jgi:hypothetical protein
MSYDVLEGLTIIPGIVSPRAIETKLISTPIKVTKGTISDLNQFNASRLGVFTTNIPPIAAKNDPSRHI